MINHSSVRDWPVVQMQIRLFIFIITPHCEEIIVLPFPQCVACISTYHHAMTWINVIR